jgi:Arc/MetJ family transcription regulator
MSHVAFVHIESELVQVEKKKKKTHKRLTVNTMLRHELSVDATTELELCSDRTKQCHIAILHRKTAANAPPRSASFTLAPYASESTMLPSAASLPHTPAKAANNPAQTVKK